MLQRRRAAGVMVIHTREGHRPDLSDCPPAKQARGKLATGIGDPGPMGRILVRGEYGHDIVDELDPHPGEPVVDKPGKGAFYATDLEAMLRDRGISQLLVCGVTTEVCVHTTVREANDRGFDCLVLADCIASYFPEFQRWRHRDDQGAGRHLRLGRAVRPRCWPRLRMNRRLAIMSATCRRAPSLVGARRLERLLRAVHQRPAQRPRADRPVLGVVKLPDDIVFGRILPALGIALPLGNLCYAYLA